MAQIIKKFIADDSVADEKIRLDNNAYLKARNAADSGNVNLLKVNASDVIEFASLPQSSGTPSTGNDLTNKTYVDAQVSAQKTWGGEFFTLAGGDITNQYVDLAQVAVTGSVMFIISGLMMRQTGASPDYTLNYTGGAGGKTRVSFANALATGGVSELVSGDTLEIRYQY